MKEFFLMLTMCSDPSMTMECQTFRLSPAVSKFDCEERATATLQTLGTGPQQNYRVRCSKNPNTKEAISL